MAGKCRIPANMISNKFGRLEVLSLDRREKRNNGRYMYYWKCQCDCGRVCLVCTYSLRQGDTKSCGCLALETRTTHNRSKTRIYKIWTCILQRCRDETRRGYKYYGGRGITVCERWYNFELFLQDMGEPAPGLTIERKNNNLGYCPENCCWADRKTQNRNRRNNLMITIDNETKCLVVWLEIYKMSAGTYYRRTGNGMSPMVALTTPIKGR